MADTGIGIGVASLEAGDMRPFHPTRIDAACPDDEAISDFRDIAIVLFVSGSQKNRSAASGRKARKPAAAKGYQRRTDSTGTRVF